MYDVFCCKPRFQNDEVFCQSCNHGTALWAAANVNDQGQQD
jgi:hypothetical protein